MSAMEEIVDEDRVGSPHKEILYNQFIPNADKIEEESQFCLAEIKYHLGNAILRKSIHHEGIYWIDHLSKYIKLYGYKFAKEEQCHLIHLLLELLAIPNLALYVVQRIASILILLLKKYEILSREDLQIEWRPLYDLYERTLYNVHIHLGMLMLPCHLDSTLKSLIRACRTYFTAESTQQMLTEWKPLLCPFDVTMAKGISYFDLFLCTKLPPEQHHQGFKLWLDDFLNIWQSCQNNPAWEAHIVWLFARAARDCSGYIDWEPYVPMVFNRLMRCFNLPFCSNKVVVHKANPDTHPFVMWVVYMMGGSSSVHIHFRRLFKALESYYHPSNSGSWTAKLHRVLLKFSILFVKRVSKERYRNSWEPQSPAECHITDAQITDFVQCLKPIILLAMFSKRGSTESSAAAHNLALLRPEIMIPPLIEQLYSSLETVTEPHRLNAAMNCLLTVSRSMVQKNRFYPEGPTHVLPLLMGSLPGIDPNDIKKCLTTSQFISIISTMVYFVDCSKHVSDHPEFTEAQKDLYLSTAAFEDFVSLFLDRCFTVIENSFHNQPSRLDRNLDSFTTDEAFTEACISCTLSTVLAHCSPAIFKTAMKKLYDFVTSRAFEVKVSGKKAARLCGCSAKVNPEMVLQLFVPHFSRLILTMTESSEVLVEETVDNEILFSLLVLSEITRCEGTQLPKYIPVIETVLTRTLHLKCREGYRMASSLLRGILRSLCAIYVVHDIPGFAERCESKDVHTLVDEWGKEADIKNPGIKFHVPTDKELLLVQKLLDTFLMPELEGLRNWVSGKSTLTRDDLHCSLCIVLNCLHGAASVLPMWPSERLHLNTGPIPLQPTCTFCSEAKEVNSPDGKNYRELILETMKLLLDHVLKTSEDDTKSLLVIIDIYYNLAFNWGASREDLEAKSRILSFVKKALGDQLRLWKKHIRCVIVERTAYQQDLRTLHRNKYTFTENHAVIMRELAKLSVSHYFDVRCRAQVHIQSFLNSHTQSYQIILPQLMESLKKNPSLFHEEFKGTLYLITGFKQNSLITFRNWELLNQLWPALISSQHSEKPSIIRLFSDAKENIQKFLSTIPVNIQVSERSQALAKKFWEGDSVLPLGPQATETELLEVYEMHEEKNKKFLNTYMSLIDKLVSLMETGDLHWRKYHLAFAMLQALIRADVKLPAHAVRLFTANLVHDTLAIRKLSVLAVACILRQLKRPHSKIEIDPLCPDLNERSGAFMARFPDSLRPANTWLQYSRNSAPREQEAWDKMHFVHNTHIGFSTWEKPLIVYAGDSEQPKLDRSRDELTEEECAVFDHFSQPAFVDKLIGFLSMEERKGHDKFDARRLEMFKGLFRNYGDTFLCHFVPYLQKLTSDKQESQHRCAAEIFTGLLRGCKHWNFQKMMHLKEQLTPILATVLGNVTPETLPDWGMAMATISESRDPNKYFWVFEFLMEHPVQEESGSFLESSWLFILLGALMQQEWRVSEFLHEILEYVMPKLNHSYQMVREKLGSILSIIFMYDVPLSHEMRPLMPNRSEFIKAVLPRIKILENNEHNDSKNSVIEMDNNNYNHTCGNSDFLRKKLDATNLFHTLCRWLIMSITRTHYTAPPELFQLLHVLCLMPSDTSDTAIQQDGSLALIVLSQALLNPDSIEAAIASLKEIGKKGSWHCRSSAVTFVRQMVFFNLFTVAHNEQWMKEIKNFLFEHLHDERLEVRESAAEALSGLLHCGALQVDNDLLSLFKEKCNKKLKRVERTDYSCQGPLLSPEMLRERHAGILGLSACISAFPYDVPDFMPEVLVLLGDHLHDPQPIQGSITKTLSNFRRTHHDSWRDHKLKFTEDQLAVITDLLVSPSYYA